MARDFQPRREGPRDDLSEATPALDAKKALFAYVAGVREKRREQGQDEVKLMSARIQEVWEVCQSEEMVLWSAKGSVRVGG